MLRFGWKGEIKALGVEKYAYKNIAKSVPIPPVIYNWSAPQLDQGDTPECGPYSFVELFYTTMRQNGFDPVLLNPHYLAKMYEEYTQEPFDGVYNRIMMAVAAKAGVKDFEGKLYFIKAYHAIDVSNRYEVANCLAEGYNFLVGIPVYENFVDAVDGLVEMPKGRFLGGHDVLIQGIDLHKNIVYGQNSWADWGFEGHTFVGNCHFQMPLEYLTSLGGDAWTITLT